MAKRYRGTVREVPTDGQESWDDYRIWQEARVVSEVEATTIPELVDLMRRYADVDQYTQQQLLRDTPPSLRSQARAADGEAETPD